VQRVLTSISIPIVWADYICLAGLFQGDRPCFRGGQRRPGDFGRERREFAGGLRPDRTLASVVLPGEVLKLRRRGPTGEAEVPARTYLIFGDIEGKLDVLRVECTKCSRKGRYRVDRLIEKYGRKANMMKWKEQLNGDCPKCDAPSLHGRCDLVCPDLPKVL
jgi:hypothetical protein